MTPSAPFNEWRNLRIPLYSYYFIDQDNKLINLNTIAGKRLSNTNACCLKINRYTFLWEKKMSKTETFSGKYATSILAYEVTYVTLPLTSYRLHCWRYFTEYCFSFLNFQLEFQNEDPNPPPFVNIFRNIMSTSPHSSICRPSVLSMEGLVSSLNLVTHQGTPSPQSNLCRNKIFFKWKLLYPGLAGEKSMSWRHHDAIARALIPGGLDKILQARFSSSTWRVSEATYKLI